MGGSRERERGGLREEEEEEEFIRIQQIEDRESFIRNNLHNGVVSGAARGQALLGPMWAGLTLDSKGDPTGDTEEPDRRRQETPPVCATQGSTAGPSRRPAKYRAKKTKGLEPHIHRIQSTGKSFRMRVEMCWEWAWQSAARSVS